MPRTASVAVPQKAKPLPAMEPVTNGAEIEIGFAEPYTAMIRVRGTCPILFHAWNCESIQEKGDSPKGSKAKKTDNLESYVYRNQAGEICIPSEYFRQSIIHAAKFKQDPRSPRKSAMDLFKAAIFSPEPLCPLGIKDWNYVDQRRVQVQRNGVTRRRPALEAGWEAQVFFACLLPEYVSPELLNSTIQMAGKLIGVADYRPTYGRFQITQFEVG